MTTTTNTHHPLLVAAKLHGDSNPLLKVLAELYGQGVRVCNVTFNGSGDSGDIQHIDYFGSDSKQLTGPSRRWCNDTQKNVDVPGDITEPEDMQDLLFELIEDNVHHDWVNNEGGGGEVNINLETLDVDISSYWNEVQQVDADGSSFNLAAEEQD